MRWTGRKCSWCFRDSVAGLAADRADLEHADAVPRRRAAVGIPAADLRHAGVAAALQLRARGAFGMRARPRRRAGVLAADGLHLADALLVPRRPAAIAVLGADLAHAGVAARRQLGA